MGTTLDIRWSPYEENIFVRLASDIATLYQVENYPDGPLTAQSVMLSNKTHACPVVSSNASVCVRCLDWCPTMEFGRLLSAGTANGKVVIVGFQQESTGRDSFRSLQNKEFVPRNLRNCSCVAWNATDPNLIAAGLDRYKNDHSLFVYDIFTSITATGSGLSRDDHRNEGETKGIVELGAGEHTVSCSWFHNAPKTLLAGFHGKGLKVYDIRESSKQPRGNAAKQVYGACSDPFGEYRLASFLDSQIAIWDLRNFDKFVVCHDVHKPVAQIAWSPTRYGLLGFTLRDTPDFRLFDVQYSHTHEDLEPFLLERTVNVTEGKSIAAFSWHPKQENRALLLSSNNQMHDLQILERMTLNWSKNHHLLWACGRDIKYLTDQDAPEPIMKAVNEDISVRMKLRSVNSYGMKTDSFLDNIPLVCGDREPEAMWKWLELIRATEGFDLIEGLNFRGIRSLLFGKPLKTESTRTEVITWVSPQAKEQQGKGVTTFISDDRERVLRLCGWGVSKDSTVDYLVSQEQFERAAAICVFNMNLVRAINILQTAGKEPKGDKLYSIIAVALAGFTSDPASIWHTSSSTLGADINQPYIRNMFLFLSSNRSDSALRRIVEDEEMVLEDRLAFACTFFADQRLIDFIKDITERFISKGVLDGLCLTGFGIDGVDLVQSYVDRTSDVQTASLLMAIVTTNEWAEDLRCHQWIENYREVLDSWMFWDARATFDVYNSRIKGGGPRIPRQISATCTFCGKPVNHTTGSQSFSARGEKLLFPRTPNVSEIPKVMTCTSCGKTLPRCALCQINMGTPTNMGFVTGEFDDESVKKAQKINPLDKWFTWCQTCRHGGHASHLAEWFKDHVDCAVTGCGCKCMLIENGCATISNNRRRIATSN